ncbi:unnamed protein product [Peronospora belbahrii]|uniref:Methyltransferase type 11 domain-containing protein n=1 Tax=Peronospora belbahrii TaxID=622444 RepID=A0AAU9L886_9STRA|nr:unnamed protein product [Peronospora belbahrii]
MEQQKLCTIAWMTKDVATGGELVRPCASKISSMGLCKKRYWEARFENKEEFDWYCKYLHIRELFVSYVSKTARVLVPGTGTSRLPAEMALDGYSDVVAMDYAANMKGWESSSVDCVIDKGCLDAMLLKPETDTEETN